MPIAPSRPCAQPTCPQPAVYRGRCREHAQLQEHARYNADIRKWYATEQWRMLRLMVLADDSICRACQRNASTEVDHVIPHRGDYYKFWDSRNLQGLCKPCHSRKTQRGE